MRSYSLLANLVTALVLIELGRDIARLHARPRLRTPLPKDHYGPQVSLLIPARNEQTTIGRCLDGALSLHYAPLELLVLDDGSTDETPSVLAAYAATGRVQVLQGQALPEGWAGKCYACQQLADAAHGEWLLFIDADTAPQPGLIAALMAYAREQQLDALSIWPFLELGSFWERAVLPAFYGLIAAVYPADRANDPTAAPDAVLANGQCLLIRRTAYAAIGGHGAVRGEILEDVRIGQALRGAGYRVGITHGAGFMRVRMYTSSREVFAGLTKNAAAGYRSGGLRSFLAATRLLLLVAAPQWLLAAGLIALRQSRGRKGWALLGQGALTLGAGLGSWGEQLHELHGMPRRAAPLYPLGVVTYLLIALRAMWQVRRGRGVVWKGRTYQG